MDILYETVVSIIKNYEGYLEYNSEMRGYCREYLSYSRWAVAEILHSLSENKTVAPLIVIDDFRDKMLKYASFNSKANVIFTFAQETAEEIIDLLM